MTTLAIMATYEKKRLKCYGTVAAGEHVAVTVTDGAQWIGEGTALRLRVLFGPDTVGVFPFADGDAWTATGTQNADAYCELNLNTLQAEKYLKHGGMCLWILDDVENHTLYATGEFEVLPWPKRRGIDEPIDLDGYPLLLDEIKDLEEAFEEYQRTVAQALAAKQDTIFDLATIRSGAAAGATAVQPSQIARFVDDAEYKAQYGEQNKPAILFKHGTNVIVALDATPFVRDGMVSDVKIVGGNLVITFNTDSGKQPISIPLTDIFDPDNYYDKTAADGKFVAKEAGKGLSTEDYTTAEKTKLAGIAAGAQVNVVETVKVNGTALTPQDKAVNIPVPTLDDAVTRTSENGVKSSGIWSALWGALAALPTGFTSLYDWCVAQLAGKASKADVDPILFAQYYPDGSVKSAAEFTPGIKYNFDTTNHTATVKPFCNTGDSENDNSGLSGRVVIPPFVDAQGNGYISDDGTRYKVSGIASAWYTGEPDAQTNTTGIVAPTTVLSVGEGAFSGCAGLVSASFPAAETVAAAAFYTCTSLVSMSLPNASGLLWDNVFWGCTSLRSVYIPRIDELSEAFMVCTSLESVDFGDTPRTSVPYLSPYAFDGVPTSCKFIVPDAQYDAWIAADGWRDLVTAGYKFLKHSEWEYARKYEVDKKADKPATFTTGNLAEFDANGNPTDAGWTAGELARYALTTKTINNGAVSLDDRAINAVAVSSSLASLTINFPTATSGKVRDFGLRLTVASGITTAPELAFPQGVVCENADGEAPEIGADGAATILYFTETASGVFLVKGEVLQTITAIS